MATPEKELIALKAALATNHPKLVGKFTDDELTGFLQESRDECGECSTEQHVKNALFYIMPVASELELDD